MKFKAREKLNQPEQRMTNKRQHKVELSQYVTMKFKGGMKLNHSEQIVANFNI